MAITLNPVRPVTDQDLQDLSERNPGYQFERTAAGQLIVTPTGGEAGQREFELTGQLRDWAVRDGRGVGFSPSTMFILPDGSRFMPDASWVLRERYQRLTERERRGWLPMCPDVAFEIAAPTDHLPDLQEKIRAYLANGIRLAVLIVPEACRVEVSRPGREVEIRSGVETVALDPELPGFALDLRPVFAR